MKAFRREGGDVGIKEIDFTPIDNEATVRVLLSGVCNTDIEITKGYADFEGTIGHEFVGEVLECPEDSSLVGKRVLGEINIGCTECDWCVAHDSRHCPNRTVLGIINRDGCHAEFVSLPARNLIELDPAIALERAVFAEPFAAAFGIMEQVEIDADTRVAVVGDGKLGILCAWAMSEKSDSVTIIGKHQNKLDTAKIDGVDGVLLDQLDVDGFDVVVEASGAESGFATALDIVRTRGKIVLKSTFHGMPKWEAWRVVVNEVTIVGSRCGMFAPANELLTNERFPIERLISDEFALSDAEAAFEKAQERGVMKVLLRP